MKRYRARLTTLCIVAVLGLAASIACFGDGEEPITEPTPDLAATIAAAVAAAVPTATPIPPTEPPPTATPEPTPDLPATLAAMLATSQATQPTVPPPPTNTPEPTAVPVAPTNTPIPQPAPTRNTNPASRIPCIVAGRVTDGGAPAGNELVLARVQEGSFVVAQDTTDSEGRYALSITEFNSVFDLFIGGTDTGHDTPVTSAGCREIRNLSIN